MTNKTCSKCLQPKSATLKFFHAYPRNLDGLRGQCKDCHRKIKKTWNATHPENILADKKRLYAANPEPALRRAKKWQQDNPERYKARMGKWYAENGGVLKESMRLDRLANPEKYREYELKKKFGITLEEFERRLNEQGKKCASCGTTDPKGPHKQWATDHDHECCPNRKKTCGKCIRGILCNACNIMLGISRDNPETLRQCAAYLERFPKDWFRDTEEPSAPLNAASVAVINSIINARVPEENFYRADADEVLV